MKGIKAALCCGLLLLGAELCRSAVRTAPPASPSHDRSVTPAVGSGDADLRDRSERIDSVTVTADRPFADIGVQKSVLGERLLREEVSFSLADMLAHNTPAFIKSYGRGTMATVSLRGTGASQTRVTWNGMRMNSPMFGMMDLSYIPAYFIDGATLYKGASSVGVTGGGLGGALALDTRPADSEGFGMKYVQGVASFMTFDEYLRLSYGGRRLRSETSVLLTTSENDFPYRNYAKKDFVLDGNGNVLGWSYPTQRNRNCGYRDFHLLQELYLDADSAGDFGLSAWYMDSSRGLPLLNTDYTESNDSRSVQDEKTFRGVLRWDKYAWGGKLSAKAGYHYSDMRYLEQSRRKYGTDSTEEVQTRSDWRSYIHTVFGDAAFERSLGKKLYLSADLSVLQHFVYTVNDQPVRNTSEPSAYDDARTELSALVSVKYRPWRQLGIALDLRQEVIGDEGAPFIPAILLDFTPFRNIVIKASVARNYRFPTINDRHFAKGPLLPENGFTYDAGIEARGELGNGGYGAALTFYDSYIRNWIFWYPDKGATQWLPANIRMVHAYGAEASCDFRYGWGGDWEVTADAVFAWTRSVNMREPLNAGDNAVGKQLPYIPVWSGAVNAHLRWRSWTLGYKWNYYSERFTTTDNSALITGRIVPYFMNDISLGKSFRFKWAQITLSFKVNNVFNEEYETELSRPMPGINYGFSIEMTPRFGKGRK